MTGSVRCELHGINGKTYCNHQRRVRKLLTKSRIVPLRTKSISDNIEIISGVVRIKSFAAGRKKRLFSTLPKGTDAGAFGCSVINTAQANGIDIKEYLTNLFRTGERRLPLKSE